MRILIQIIAEIVILAVFLPVVYSGIKEAYKTFKEYFNG